jgi:hypothetical protein
VNVSNKETRTAVKPWSFNLLVGSGANKPPTVKTNSLRGCVLWHDVGDGKTHGLSNQLLYRRSVVKWLLEN